MVSRQRKGAAHMPARDLSAEAELASVRLLDPRHNDLVDAEGCAWMKKVRSSQLKQLQPTDHGLVVPLKGNVYADRVLFMLTTAQEHVFARCIGSVDGKYVSNLLHGRMGRGGIEFDDTPLFHDGVSREDPRAMLINGKIYLTYTRLEGEGGGFSVGLSVIDDPAKPHDVRELGPIISMDEPGLDCKDSVMITEKVNGKHFILTRLKPGIQAVGFDSMQDIERLALDSDYRGETWAKFRSDYKSNPAAFNHLHPNTPEMMVWEARWKPFFEGRIRELIAGYPEASYFNVETKTPHWYGTGPTPLKSRFDGQDYWLSFHHRGQVIGTPTQEGINKREDEHRRVENLKFYCIIASMHRYDDPTKLVAVSPLPLLVPSPSTQREAGLPQNLDPVTDSYAVPFVYITAGATRVTEGDKSKILIPAGVNDMYTAVKGFDEKQLTAWMMRDGRLD